MTKDQMTHKNPELRSTSVVKASEKRSGACSAKKPTPTLQHEPVLELQGKKWVVVSVAGLNRETDR